MPYLITEGLLRAQPRQASTPTPLVGHVGIVGWFHSIYNPEWSPCVPYPPYIRPEVFGPTKFDISYYFGLEYPWRHDANTTSIN